jgi:hypothetical protein
MVASGLSFNRFKVNGWVLVMATNKEIDAQFEQTILQALHTMSNGLITIVKQNNQVIQVNIDETCNSSNKSETKRQRGHLTLISDKDAG